MSSEGRPRPIYYQEGTIGMCSFVFLWRTDRDGRVLRISWTCSGTNRDKSFIFTCSHPVFFFGPRSVFKARTALVIEQLP